MTKGMNKMSYKIKSMSKSQLGRICQGAQDANARLEAQQSREFSMSVIALLTVLSCLLGLFLLFKFILVAVGCYHWWSMLLLWFAVSAVFTGCMILPRMISERSKKGA